MSDGLRALMQKHTEELEREQAAHRDALALCEVYEAQIADLQSRLDAAQTNEWVDATHNDCIRGDVGSIQIRVVKDHSKKDKGLYLHVQKRMMGEWAHVGLTKLPDNWRLLRRATSGTEASDGSEGTVQDGTS